MTGWIGLVAALLAASTSAIGKHGTDWAPSAPCLGRPVADCARRVAKLMGDVDSVERQLTELDEVDVNGRPIAHHSIMIAGKLSEASYSYVTASIHFDRDRQVTSLEIGLPMALYGRQTFGDYDSTGIYDAMTIAFGPDCMERGEFYRFVHNKIEPALKTASIPPTLGPGSATHDETSEESAKLPFCGHKISYSNASGYASWAIKLGNLNGAYSQPKLRADR